MGPSSSSAGCPLGAAPSIWPVVQADPMTQFSLSALTLAVPSYCQSDLLARLRHDWRAGVWSTIDGGIDGIVVLDVAGAPLGYLPLVVLGALDLPDHTPLAHQVQGLEPLGQVSEQASLMGVWQALQQHPQQRLAVVGTTGTYRGLLCPQRLLHTWLQNRASPWSEPGNRAQHTTQHATKEREQRWLLELSHGLKTPLASLLGLSTLMLDHRLGSLNGRQQRYGELIQQTVRQLVRLVQQLLDWVHLESDQLVLHPETIQLDPFGQTLVPAYGNHSGHPEALSQWQAQFSWQQQPELTTVVADPLRLRQIVHYLLDYGWATQVTPAQLQVEAWGRWIAFSLTFAHRSPPNSAWRQGTSLHLNYLQLVLAKRLLALHGGELVVVPSQDCVQFTALLPQGEGAAAPAPLVLLVTTSAAVVERVSTRFGPGSGVGLVVADGWDQACDWVQRLQPRLVLEPLHPLALPTDDAGAIAFHHLLPEAHIPLVGVGDLDSSQGAPPPQAPMVAVVNLTLTTWAEDLQRYLAPHRPSPEPGPTFLYLRLSNPLPSASGATAMALDWAAGLKQHNGRLLVADAVPQAIALSQVWHPVALLLDVDGPRSATVLSAVATSPLLRTYPLITLTPAVTAAAQHVAGLTVVCGADLQTQPPGQAVSALLQRLVQQGQESPSA